MIHSTAVINENAKIGLDVKIGPYCVIGPDVELGDGCELRSHVVIDGHTKIGKNNKFFTGCIIGEIPQDLTYKGEPTRVVIGDNNVFREFVTVHRGTKKDREETTLGSNCLFMVHCHFGHDVVVGNNCIFANGAQLAGHVKIRDNVILGGGCVISQFVTLGEGAYIGGATAINRDIPMFCTAYGNRARLKGINIIGMKRKGFSKEVINEVVDFFRTVESSALSSRSFVDNHEFMAEYEGNPIVNQMANFIKESSIGIAPFMSL
ncbi:MAG: acyl-ACP--UDP-N-acetylglucosamine O-acyltransferase [Halobacteriovoraceae bacterium]|nr:acyl-ACP--UDP-N-acetylglucosamine O-acyltransferase [Halobacteriovoraceae bacterium]